MFLPVSMEKESQIVPPWEMSYISVCSDVEALVVVLDNVQNIQGFCRNFKSVDAKDLKCESILSLFRATGLKTLKRG